MRQETRFQSQAVVIHLGDTNSPLALVPIVLLLRPLQKNFYFDISNIIEWIGAVLGNIGI